MTPASFRRIVLALAVASAAFAGCAAEPDVAAAVEAAPATAPGDDGAGGKVEDAACPERDIACHERLYQLEETLFQYEAGIARQLGEPARACWQSDSEAFRKLLDACHDVACREAALRDRLASLHDLQRSEDRAALELPEVPILVAVLGPEPEAPPSGAPVPFEARGALVHASEHVEHMGIAVHSDSGHDHVIVPDMDIGSQPGHDAVLGLVGTSPTAQVLVRGYRRVAADGIADFDISGCRLVYQLP